MTCTVLKFQDSPKPTVLLNLTQIYNLDGYGSNLKPNSLNVK